MQEETISRAYLSLFHEGMVWARIIGFLRPTLTDESNFRGQVLCSLDADPDVEQTPQEDALT